MTGEVLWDDERGPIVWQKRTMPVLCAASQDLKKSLGSMADIVGY